MANRVLQAKRQRGTDTTKPITLIWKPGAKPMRCPKCSRKIDRFLDGDSISVRRVLPEARVVAGGMALSDGGHCFSASLNLAVCERCERESYVVQIDEVDRPDISEDWASKYFCLNEPIEEPSLHYTVSATAAGLPRKWLVETLDTEQGFVHRYTFGPFAVRESLQGVNGVSHCMGGKVWEDAAELVGRVWPLITTVWFESLTLHGSSLLRPVEGWFLN
jgi:hypothetical protein